MIDYGIVESTIQPEQTVIDDYSVWVNSSIAIVEKEDFSTKLKTQLYQYHCIKYDKNEYIKEIEKKTKTLEEQIESQEARLTYTAMMTDTLME